VLLLEAVEPGTKVSTWPELPALADVAALIRALRDVPEGDTGQLLSLPERVEFLFSLITRRRESPRVASLVEPVLVERGCQAARRLAADGRAGLVHGDLHPGNVLDAGPARGLVAIDPRPCLGDPDFDVVDWVLARATSTGQVRDQIRRLAGLVPGLDGERVWGWCTATAVIIAVQHLRQHAPDATTDLLLHLAAAV
jgi:streptomycin 6-kinase